MDWSPLCYTLLLEVGNFSFNPLEEAGRLDWEVFFKSFCNWLHGPSLPSWDISDVWMVNISSKIHCWLGLYTHWKLAISYFKKDIIFINLLGYYVSQWCKMYDHIFLQATLLFELFKHTTISGETLSSWVTFFIENCLLLMVVVWP